MVEVTISQVKPACCDAHVDVVLHATDADRYLRLRIGAEAGRALMSELQGVTTLTGRVVDAMSATLCAAGCTLRQCALSSHEGDLQATMTFDSPSGCQSAKIDACTALLIVCRQRIPLIAPDPPAGELPAGLPASVESFLDNLDFGGLDAS